MLQYHNVLTHELDLPDAVGQRERVLREYGQARDHLPEHGAHASRPRQPCAPAPCAPRPHPRQLHYGTVLPLADHRAHYRLVTEVILIICVGVFFAQNSTIAL